ncbi:MAG: hypothetical protein ABI592_04945 [Acidobacteriota bacterium]
MTCAAYPDLVEDDRILQRALEERGVRTRAAVWNDPAVRWSEARMAVVRSTWDYHLHPREFEDWVRETGSRTALVNPPELILWNIHKSYLLELADRGLATVPTILVEKGSPAALSGILESAGWPEVVVKPAVSASAYRTRRIRAAHGGAEGESHLREILESSDALVQPYVEAVESEGERSLVFVDGVLTHAFRRAPFNAGWSAGLSSEVGHEPSAEESAFGRRALSLLPVSPLYARVDVIPAPNGPRLMELELVEPSLEFRLFPPAAGRFADAVLRRMGDG